MNKEYFKDNNEIKKIALPPNIRLICNESFFGCTNLTQIYIPSSVTSIGECAFGRCSNLTHISIPSSVTTIGEGIFANCDELKNITIRHNSEERIEYLIDKPPAIISKSDDLNDPIKTPVQTRKVLSPTKKIDENNFTFNEFNNTPLNILKSKHLLHKVQGKASRPLLHERKIR